MLTDFSATRESEANYIRPAVVVTNNEANAHAHILVVIPITSNLGRVGHYDLELPNNRTGLDRDTKAQVNLIRHVSVSRFVKTLGHVPTDLMLDLDARIREHLAL